MRKKMRLVVEIDPRRCARTAKEIEKEAAERHRLLCTAREIAERCARSHPFRLCTVDDVFFRLKTRRCPLRLYGRIAAHIFRAGNWSVTRLRVRSRRVHGRGREVKVWCWRGEKSRSERILGDVAFFVDDHKKARNGTSPSGRVERCSRCREVLPDHLGKKLRRGWVCAFCSSRR